MNILMLTRFYLNGQTTHVLALCSELAKMGHNLILCIENLHHPGYIQWLRKQRLKYVTTSDPSNLEYLIKKYQIEVIHTHSAHTINVSLNLGKQYHIPVIATCHYLDFPPIEQLNEATQVIAISEEMKQTLKLPDYKTVMIENGINTNQLKPVINKNLSPKAVIITRMTKEKEPGYIHLTNILINSGWHVKSIGNWRPPYGTTYVNWMVDLTDQLNQADLVVGTGRTIREGMAAGCSALILGDYLDGLVTPENVENLRKYNFSGRATKQIATIEALTKVILKLTPLKLRELQKFSYEYSRNFSIRKMSNQILEIYRSSVSFSLANSKHSDTSIKSTKGASAINR